MSTTDILGKVRSLLAKAESTTFPEEAEALTAKAAELMQRYAIDAAMLDAEAVADARRRGERPEVRHLLVEDPYASAKYLLLSAVASAHRGQVVWSRHDRRATVVAFPADLVVIETLFTSLLLQAGQALVHAIEGAPSGSRLRSRSYRRAFLVGYADRIHRRLAAVAAAARTAGEAQHGASLHPVLARRDAEVQRAVGELFPSLRRMSVSVSDGAGMHAGARAADRADVGLSAHVGPAGRRLLPRGP
jgi:hypothetical protein